MSVLTNETRDCLAYIADSASLLVDTSAATGCESGLNDVVEHERSAQLVFWISPFCCQFGYAFLFISGQTATAVATLCITGSYIKVNIN